MLLAIVSKELNKVDWIQGSFPEKKKNGSYRHDMIKGQIIELTFKGNNRQKAQIFKSNFKPRKATTSLNILYWYVFLYVDTNLKLFLYGIQILLFKIFLNILNLSIFKSILYLCFHFCSRYYTCIAHVTLWWKFPVLKNYCYKLFKIRKNFRVVVNYVL